MTPEAPVARHGLTAVNVYIGVVIGVAAALAVVTWVYAGFPDDVVALVTLAGLAVLGVRLAEPDVGSRIGFSFMSVILVACTVLVGPTGSILVGVLALSFDPGRKGLRVRVFNVAMVAILGASGAWVFRFASHHPLSGVQGAGALLTEVGLPLLAADVVQMLTNATLLSGVVCLSSGVPFRRFFVQIVTNTGVAYIGYGVIGFLLVVLWVPADVGPFSAVLILAPLFVARWTFVQYGEEQRSHERALSALVTAVETKDPYASGHSARTAQLVEWLAEPLGLRAQEVPSLRYSAMLHDVGKVGVPTRLLRRSRTWAADDVAALERHAEDGARLVEDIDFLGPSRAAIRHHHERWDGTGYPDGLAGPHIPLASRVIAVVDAFDALTTTGAGRPGLSSADALAEIERRAGTWFDPTVTAALATVVARRPWPPEAPAGGAAQGVRGADAPPAADAVGYVDHDDPEVWERLRGVGQRPGTDATAPGKAAEHAKAADTHTPVVVGPP